jgi:hypothetical protein
MKCNRRVLVWTLILGVPFIPAHSLKAQPSGLNSSQRESDDKPVDPGRLRQATLWHDPGAISELDLFYGQGGKDGAPVAPFTFQAEDTEGTNPKFDVLDARGTKWRVKLGDEARPEVVASRLLWAVGYFANDDYALAEAKVENLQIARGSSSASDGNIVDARFQKKPDGKQKIGIWKWSHNPFTGSKEFNGLRVMMAVLNNWDLKDVNNAVLEDSSGKDILMVSDVGSSFATNGLSWNKGRSKGDIDTFEKSKFVTRNKDSKVDFATPAAPAPIDAVNVKQYKMRHDLQWIGKDIPVEDARWVGSLLKQLSHKQLVDAFRAGQFHPEETERYVRVLESRIKELSEL